MNNYKELEGEKMTSEDIEKEPFLIRKNCPLYNRKDSHMDTSFENYICEMIEYGLLSNLFRQDEKNMDENIAKKCNGDFYKCPLILTRKEKEKIRRESYGPIYTAFYGSVAENIKRTGEKTI